MPSPIGEYMTTALFAVLERMLIIFNLDLDISNLPDTTASVHSIIFLLKRDNLELRQPYITGCTKYEVLGRAVRANPAGYSWYRWRLIRTRTYHQLVKLLAQRMKLMIQSE
jgi:hypothetical protein